MLNKNNTLERVRWVDIGRGICMILVLLYHSEYYCINSDSLMQIYKPFFMSYFFFITGYFFKSEIIVEKLKSIIITLLIPYLFFTTIIWLPKNLMRNNSIEVFNAFKDIFLGYASWFVAALIVVEIIFAILIKYVSDEKKLILISLVFYFLYSFLSDLLIFEHCEFPWHCDKALCYIIFVTFGYICSFHRNILDKIFEANVILMFLIYMGLLGLFFYLESFFLIKDIVYLLCSMFGILFIISLSNYISKNKLLEFIGQKSLIFYFLNGGIILILSHFCISLGLVSYVSVFVICTIAVIVIIPISLIIEKYISFLSGNKKKFYSVWSNLKNIFR